MMVASEADEAWCPPTFNPRLLSRTWLAWWMVQAPSQRTFFSSSLRMVRWESSGIGVRAFERDRILGRRIANSEWRMANEAGGYPRTNYSLFATHYSLVSERRPLARTHARHAASHRSSPGGRRHVM